MAKATWRQIDRKRKAYRRRWAIKIRNEYKQLAKPVIIYLKANGPGDGVKTVIEQLPVSALENAVKQMYIEVGTAFALDSATMLKGRRFMMEQKDFLQDKWTARMLSYAENEAGALIESIKLTAKKDIQSLVGRVVAELAETGIGIIGTDPNAAEMIAGLFADEWGRAANWMGRRVAQTEVIRASNYATMEGVKELGVPYYKAWLVAADGKERESHRIAADENTQVPENQPFIVSGYYAEYPGDPNLPPAESINCRCAATAFPVD